MVRGPVLFALSLSLAAAACGKPNQNAHDASGSEPPAATSLSTNAPASLPAYAPVYPGATVSSSVSGIGGQASGMMTFTTVDAPEQVLAFYRQRAAGAGLTQVSETTQNQARIFVASKPGSKESVNVTTAPDPAGGTFVQLTYG